MSAIALSWVATLTVGNQTAKQLLLFYASHNFGKPGFEFKNCTLSKQLETSERSIQRAHKLLEKEGYIKRIEQFDSDGQQQSTVTYLNISQEFIDNFFNRKEGEGDSVSPPLRHTVTPGVTVCHPYNNKLNNNINNSSCKKVKKETKAKKTKAEYQEENKRKHEFSGSKDAMACESKHIHEHEQRKREEMSRARYSDDELPYGQNQSYEKNRLEQYRCKLLAEGKIE